MYRPDARSIWQIDNDVQFNYGGVLTDKQGTVKINALQKGQYALAIYDANKVDSPQAVSTCYPLGIPEIATSKVGFRAYPNPVNSDELTIEIDAQNVFGKCEITNMMGAKVIERTIGEGQTKLVVSMKALARGTYVVSLIDKDNKRISKKIQN